MSLLLLFAGVEGEVIVQKLLGQPFEMGYNAMDDRIEVRVSVGLQLLEVCSLTLLFKNTSHSRHHTTVSRTCHRYLFSWSRVEEPEV